jgi:hypothetical protein
MRGPRLLLVLGLLIATAPTLVPSVVASASTDRTPSCVSDQLAVFDSQWLAAAGNGAMVFDVANTGARCHLEGYPSVEFLDAKQRPVDYRDTHNYSSMQFAEVKKSMVTLAAGGIATFGVSFSDNPVNNDSCPKVVSAVVQLRGGVGQFWGEFPIRLSPCGNGLLVTPIEKGAWPRPNG